MPRYLVTAALYTLGPFGPDTELRRFGLKLAERGGKAAKKRAVASRHARSRPQLPSCQPDFARNSSMKESS